MLLILLMLLPSKRLDEQEHEQDHDQENRDRSSNYTAVARRWGTLICAHFR